MIEPTCTQERFERDVKDHIMEIVKDEDNYRHIRFRRKDSITYWFDLITWPGYLCITGDCGTFVFARVSDMFTFFRDDSGKDKLYINPGYWGEKVRAMDRDGVSTYSNQHFEEAVRDHFDMWFEDGGNEDIKEHCWERIEADVLYHSEDGYHAAMNAAMEFRCGEFTFHDFWEYNVHEYTFYYRWCLYAIVHGIKEYDKVPGDG